jgi:soluble lytic murein transglycosylase
MRFIGLFIACIYLNIVMGTYTSQSQSLPSSVKNIFSRNSTAVGPASMELFFRGFLTRSGPSHLRWWAHYHLGQLWSESNRHESCKHFEALSREPEFPLRAVADLRRMEYCHVPTSELTHLFESEFSREDTWIEPLALNVGLSKAYEIQNWEAYQRLLMRKAEVSRHQSEKIEYLGRALEIEKEHQLGRLQEIEKKLTTVAPRFNTTPGEKEYLSVAADFRKAREFDRARSYYEKIAKHPKTSDAQKIDALQGIKMSYKLERRKEDYILASGESLKFAKTLWGKAKHNSVRQKYLFDATLSHGRALWTQGKSEEAEKIFTQLEGELGRKTPLGEVQWLRARIEEERGNFLKAIEWAEAGIQSSPKKSVLRERFQWLLSWNHRKVRQFTKANEILASLREEFQNSGDTLKYQYWTARNLRELGQEETAVQTFEALTSEDPLGFYGLLAHRELQKPFSPLLNQDNLKALPPPESGDVFRWLITLNETTLAQRFLNTAHSRGKGSGQPDHVMESLTSWARAGYFNNVFARLTMLNTEERKKVLNEHPDLIFPKNHLAIVLDSADRFGINPNLVYSIIRQESAFDARARSPADAFGLMQLLPETAERVAREVQVPYQDAEDLYQPKTNIPLGTAYLKELWNQYQGQFILTVASYNASEDAVRAWMKTRYRGDPTEFIEDIPYEETRTYVKLIMRNLIFYMRRGSDTPIPFPEWCLDGLQDFKS